MLSRQEAPAAARKHRSVNPADRHVALRVRARRLQIGMSQGKLGDELGLTFQQIQKYEKGTNRIASGRLADIARILDVPVAWFYEGAPSQADVCAAAPGAAPCDLGAALLATRDGLRLARAFLAIANDDLRQAVITTAEAAAAAAPVEGAVGKRGP